jgi:HPt (histidine-containing phosphotransfer) domain-containing protein
MAPEKNQTSSPFLREEALERVGGDGEFLNELLTLYDQEFADKRNGLAEAIARRDAAQIREFGHALKGSSANLSLPGLREAAAAMEKAGAAGDIASAEEAYVRLEREYARLKAFLGGSPR